MSNVARVGLVGYMHEVNALATPIGLGHGLQLTATPGGLSATWEAGGAMRRLRELRNVEFVELPVWEFAASGPLQEADFQQMLGDVRGAVRSAGPVDALLVLGHGAGRTTTDLDSDATFLRMLRDEVGAAPLVMVLDFHANVSGEMCDLVDVMVGYRTNPHVDIEARAVEAAEHVHRLLDGDRSVVAMCRPPMVLPQLAQNTLPGEALHAVMALAEALIVPPVHNVSVFGGFSLGDVPHCGLSVCVSADADAADVAARAAEQIAALAWSIRQHYRLRATPVSVAVNEALRASRGERAPVILADTADNPGGGAPGNTTFLLRALLEAGATDVVMGLQCDPAVVRAAWEAGEGAHIRVCFNEGSTDQFAEPLEVEAEVLALVHAPLVPTKGVYDGSSRYPSRCCALRIDGVRVGVSSYKVQCADDDTLLHVGLDPATARVTVVKSRGHFRAGFAHLFANDQIIEVGTRGVATAEIDTIEWQHMPRPVFPFDEIDAWEPHATLHRASVTS